MKGNADIIYSSLDNLAVSALGFRRGANRVRKQMWWKDMKMRMCIVVGIIILLVIIIVPVVITFVQLPSTPNCGYMRKTLSDCTLDLAKNNRAVWERLFRFFWRGSGFHRHGGVGNLALPWLRSPGLGWWWWGIKLHV